MDTPRYLGPLHHPAFGVRIPEIFLEGIMRALKSTGTAAGLMLSYHRETAPESVINAPPGVFEITRGHTGTSIRHYISASVEAARRYRIVVEIEADHLAALTSSVEAVKRISGAHASYSGVGSLDEALSYVEEEVKEAASTGYINFFTLDSCDYIDYGAEKLSDYEALSLLEQVYGDSTSILRRYTMPRRFIAEDGKFFEVKLREGEVARIALKLHRALGVLEKLHQIVRKHVDWQVGFEIAFDETPHPTRPEELLFLMEELRLRGLQPHFVAPNVGFEKRADYRGDLGELRYRVARLAAIARSYGALLSFHSGSGSSPWSGKGQGVYEVLLEATGGRLKYKISGVYYELLLSILSRQPLGSKARRLYEELYQSVIDFLRDQVRGRKELYSDALARQLDEYETLASKGDAYLLHAEVFRHYSFIALNLRVDGRRIFRESLVELYNEDEQLRKTIDREVAELTLRLVDGLKFSGNTAFLSC
uniref:Uncharacterized protein n=1 Tax=Thermofilum pendens TaxID=2269 RepID=A0A7C4FFT1_THEPE